MKWQCGGCGKTFVSDRIGGWGLCPLCKVVETIRAYHECKNNQTHTKVYYLRILVRDLLKAVQWVYDNRKGLSK